MHVDIHLRVRKGQEQRAHGKLANHHTAFATAFQRFAQRRAAEIAPVDEKGLLLPVPARKLAHAHITAERNAQMRTADTQHLLEGRRSVQAVKDGLETAVAHASVDGFAVHSKAKRDIRPGQEQPQHIV